MQSHGVGRGKRWECLNLCTHQYTRSRDPSEVPNLVCKVFIFFNHSSSREKQQNVSEGTQHSQGDKSGSQALSTISCAHVFLKKWPTQFKAEEKSLRCSQNSFRRRCFSVCFMKCSFCRACRGAELVECSRQRCCCSLSEMPCAGYLYILAAVMSIFWTSVNEITFSTASHFTMTTNNLC